MKITGTCIAETAAAFFVDLDENSHRYWIPQSVITTDISRNVKTQRIEFDIADWWWEEHKNDGTSRPVVPTNEEVTRLRNELIAKRDENKKKKTEG